MNIRKRGVAHNVWLFAAWALVMWLGVSAIDRADSGGAPILGFYVLFTAFGVVAILDHFWKKPD
jgi:hypothetical protein